MLWIKTFYFSTCMAVMLIATDEVIFDDKHILPFVLLQYNRRRICINTVRRFSFLSLEKKLQLETGKETN